MLLRTGKTPSVAEIAGHVRRLIQRIRCHWPRTRITLRDDGHYGRPEIMAWCEANKIDYVFGLPVNRMLSRDGQAHPIVPCTVCPWLIRAWQCNGLRKQAARPGWGKRQL
jgi:hypothetical protein